MTDLGATTSSIDATPADARLLRQPSRFRDRPRRPRVPTPPTVTTSGASASRPGTWATRSRGSTATYRRSPTCSATGTSIGSPSTRRSSSSTVGSWATGSAAPTSAIRSLAAHERAYATRHVLGRALLVRPRHRRVPVAQRASTWPATGRSCASPVDHERFPADLHIDFLPAARGAGVGRRMVTEWIDSRREAGTPGRPPRDLGREHRRDRVLHHARVRARRPTGAQPRVPPARRLAMHGAVDGARAVGAQAFRASSLSLERLDDLGEVGRDRGRGC